jgi:hypothetical protein
LDKNHKENEPLAQTITNLIKKEKPNTIQQLIELTINQTSTPEQEIIKQIKQLQNKGIIKLHEPPQPTPQTLSSYLKKTEAHWYWTTLVLTIAATISALTIAEDAYPLAYIRYILGSPLILFLPGYGLTKALFPKHTPFQTSSTGLDQAIRIALSIGLSISIVPIITLFLDHTPLGVRLTPILLSVLSVTLISATIGLARQHKKSQT